MATNIRLDRSLAPDDLAMLQRAGAAAFHAGIELWLVGGSVRDALLGVPVTDIDLTAERPAGEVATVLTPAGQGAVSARSQFGTLKLRLDGRTVDLATARRETYPRPGALPVVQPGTLADDLARRDVSINAMAASLAPGRLGALLDPHGGADDLHRRLVRVLHEASFRDDATRILRVIRYAVRLDFRIDRRTLRWLQRDVSFIDSISPARLRRELERVLAEPRAVEMLSMANRFGFFAALHPAFDGERVAAALRRARRSRRVGARGAGARQAAPLRPAPLALLGYAAHGDVAAVAQRLGLTKAQTAVFVGAARLRELEPAVAEAGARPSAIAALGRNVPRASVEACAAATPSSAVRRRMRAYLDAHSHKPPVSGDDLLRLGVPQGPLTGRLLREVDDRWLDGAIRSKSAAERYVRRRMRELADQ